MKKLITISLILIFSCLISFAQGNMAINKPVTTSTVGSNVYPKYSNDGNTSSSWNSLSTNNTQWLQLDLNDVYDLTQIKINWAAASAASYSISTSSNATDWVVVSQITSTNLAHIKTIDLSNVSTVRYVRVDLISPNTSNGYSINEIEIYGALSSVTVVPSVSISPKNEFVVPDYTKAQILSLNNSLIDYNDQPSIFNPLAISAGKTATWQKQTRLGQSLRYHYEEGDGILADGTITAKYKIRSKAWSHIILQEQSDKPLTNYADFLASVKLWVDYIRTNCPNPNARILLFVNWPYSTSVDFGGDMARLWNSYLNVATETGVSILPVGKAYEFILNKDGVNAKNALFSDDRHPTLIASYMSACTILAGLYETNPEGIEYYPSSITATDAQRLQTRAKEASLTYTNTCDLNGKIHFTANLIDQFNRSVENTSSTVWSVSGGGTIDQTGTFTSNKTPGGYTATATIGNLSANVTFEVKSAPGSTDAESGILKNQVCVDFGGWCANSAKESWNVLQGFVSGGILNMIDTNGDSTKISISVTKRFTAINWLGGGNTVAVNSWVFPHYSVTYDSFYGNTTTEGYSQLTISGLNSTQSYNFSFFGSCFGSAADQGTQTLVSDNRETSYTVKGETEGSASLAASNNLTQIAQIDNIKADANGNIIINIQKGSNNNTTNGTYFLNCMKLAPVSNTSGFKNNTLEQIAFFDFNNKKLHINDEVVSKSMIYNVNGMLVSTLNGAGVFDISNLRAGVYILKSIDRDDTQHIQRFILQ